MDRDPRRSRFLSRQRLFQAVEGRASSQARPHEQVDGPPHESLLPGLGRETMQAEYRARRILVNARDKGDGRRGRAEGEGGPSRSWTGLPDPGAGVQDGAKREIGAHQGAPRKMTGSAQHKPAQGIKGRACSRTAPWWGRCFHPTTPHLRPCRGPGESIGRASPWKATASSGHASFSQIPSSTQFREPPLALERSFRKFFALWLVLTTEAGGRILKATCGCKPLPSRKFT